MYNKYERMFQLYNKNKAKLIAAQAVAEGIDITTKSMENILEGDINFSDYNKNDLTLIENINRSWSFLWKRIDDKLTIQLIKEIHSSLSKSLFYNRGRNEQYKEGTLRVQQVRVGNYYPPTLSTEAATREINGIIHSKNKYSTVEEYALGVFALLAKGQYFNDVNKRTAMMVSNKILIQNNIGILHMPFSIETDFFNQLLAFYLEEIDKNEYIQYLKQYILRN